jgi:hypothetical protein
VPILRVTENGNHLCTVGSDDVWMFSASVWGDIWGPEVSTLDVHGGGKLRADGSTDFLIWEMPHELTRGDRIRLSFEEGSTSSPKGQLFEDEPPANAKPDFSVPPADEELRKLESRPSQNAALVWLFSLNDGPGIQLQPDSSRQHLSVHVLWNERRPDRLRVNLSKSSLREIASRVAGEEVFLEYLPIGAHVEIAIGI